MPQKLVYKPKIGEMFGYWQVVGTPRYKFPVARGYYVQCVCRCGTCYNVYVRDLCTGKSQSCGCKKVFESKEAKQQLEHIWRNLPTIENPWNNWDDFYFWAIQNGFKKGSKLCYHSPGYSRNDYYWNPRRLIRKARPYL